MQHTSLIRRALSTSATALATTLALAACGDTNSTSQGATMSTTTSTGAHTEMIAINGTTLAVDRIGSGRPALLIHGAGEDAAMLAGQAGSLAHAGFEVITYDRRGTGRSGRDAWPAASEAAADQHADDAAALIDELELEDPIVVGVSSGGVVALRLAARHADQIGRVIAWEPPLAGIIPGGAELSAQIMQPINEHLAEHPDDFVGAQAILLSAIVGFPVSADDPAFADARANAEPMIRDEPNITLAAVTADELAGRDITLATGSEPNDLIATAAAELAALEGIDIVQVEGSHEIYMTDPSVLTGIVVGARS